MLSVPPSPLFMDNMDLHQLSCSFYLWQILVPGIIENMLPMKDWAIVELMFTQESWGGLVQRDLAVEDVEHFKDAAAAPGAMKAALSYHRCAQCDPMRHWRTFVGKQPCTAQVECP